nr:immunoglobulin heavy chain junction region [Macaca mulatta]MOX58817.1 immunoglobulin heavy chain junction region [Macaca mulatta]MOX59202.1 immunoglobulin heavy chain junction region [Macaca mulatta]MOX59282.1 immunoglobulin heavy chain junction region [Macaca mulatta]MOX59607.1 immunoglobulin heavy chain junction region [Macaca mulatta]
CARGDCTDTDCSSAGGAFDFW